MFQDHNVSYLICVKSLEVLKVLEFNFIMPGKTLQ